MYTVEAAVLSAAAVITPEERNIAVVTYSHISTKNTGIHCYRQTKVRRQHCNMFESGKLWFLNHVNNDIGHNIYKQDTNYRKEITVQEKLVVSRYLDSGDEVGVFL